MADRRRLGDMRPMYTASNQTDGSLRHAVFACEFLQTAACLPFHPDLSDLIRSDFSESMFLTSPNERRVQSKRMPVTFARSAFGHSVVDIVLIRTEKQMIRPDAGRVVTRVQNVHALRNIAMNDQPSNAVSVGGRKRRNAKLSVAVSVSGSNPFPAVIPLDDSAPETFDYGRIRPHLTLQRSVAEPPVAGNNAEALSRQFYQIGASA